MGRQAGEVRLLGRGAGHHEEQINCHAAIPQTSPRGTTPTTGRTNVYGRTWTPTRMQAFSSDGSAQCGQAQSYIRPLDCGASLLPRARMEMRGSGPNRALELGSSFHTTGFPDPVSLTVCPYVILRPAYIPPSYIRSPAAQAAGAGSL